jgi:DNA-binding FadR family transcriptional regulator
MKTIINKKSLADEIAARLQEQISLGYYKVAEKLPIEPELMKEFGVGRSTIREAIKILSNSGLLRVQQGAGTFVEQIIGSREPMDQRLKRANMQDLEEVRELLEMKIAEKAAVHRSEKDILTIKKHLEDRKLAAKAGLLEACVEADIQFHVAIAEASKNEILAELYKATSIHLKKWLLHVHAETQAFESSYHLHEQLLKNIIARDPKRAWNTAAKIIGHVSQ